MVKVKIEKKDKEPEREKKRLEPLEEKKPEPAKAEIKPGAEAEPVEDEIFELKKRIDELEKQNLYLRADFANYKRNADQERGWMIEQGKEMVLKDLFTIFEHLERAIVSGREHKIEASVLEGLELVRKGILKVLEKYRVERISTVGEKFDPKVHEAISVMESPDQEPGSIVYEHQPGFLREGKVIQPARVVVAKEKA